MNKPDTNYKATYESVKDDPTYEAVKEYWEFMGTVGSIQDVQRKFKLSATKVLNYKYAYRYERSMDNASKEAR